LRLVLVIHPDILDPSQGTLPDCFLPVERINTALKLTKMPVNSREEGKSKDGEVVDGEDSLDGADSDGGDSDSNEAGN
jgi:hypothetical protein